VINIKRSWTANTLGVKSRSLRVYYGMPISISRHVSLKPSIIYTKYIAAHSVSIAVSQLVGLYDS